jgi:RNA polymerase sigma-70 factor (ECF subfamily)
VALNELCEIYWPCVYAFVRRDRQRTAADAADLTQEFLADLLARDDIAGVDRERGRFRAWLRQSLRHFLSNQSDRQHAQKRGGGQLPMSLDADEAERRYLLDPGGLDPEKLYARRWAMVAVERALATLRSEYMAGDEKRSREFDGIQEALLGEPLDGGYEALAVKLNTTAGALRQVTNRWRKVLQQEVAETMGIDGDVEAEIRELISALA